MTINNLRGVLDAFELDVVINPEFRFDLQVSIGIEAERFFANDQFLILLFLLLLFFDGSFFS